MLWEQLELKQASILGKWFQLILDTYPSNSGRFLKQEKDNCLNPVGCTISQEIATLYNELLHEMNLEKIDIALDRIIRIRAVQEFIPSQTVGFILKLKQAVREELSSEVAGNINRQELIEFESRIDMLTLLAVDTFVKCREKIFEIRVSELTAQRESALTMLARANQNNQLSEVA